MPDIDFFKDPEFADLKSSLDAEMKKIQSSGKGSIKKQAEPLSLEEEELLWEKKLLGDHSPETLLNTIVFMNGLYIALRSWNEHRDLRQSMSDPTFEPPDERAFFKYTVDTSKNRPEDSKDVRSSQRLLSNPENPQRCFVELFKKYNNLCP